MIKLGLPHKCPDCVRTFRTEANLANHRRASHRRGAMSKMTREGAMAVMDEMDDLPDGAYFQLAADLGLSPDDFGPCNPFR